MACQLTLTDGVRYRCPLSVTDRRTLFAEWCELNGEMLSRIEQKALALAAMGHRRISTQYLVEWARYELPIRAVAVPYEDEALSFQEFAEQWRDMTQAFLREASESLGGAS